MARLKDKYRRQVQAESKLRYGPQEREAREALREVGQRFKSDVRIARSTARGTKRTLKAMQPQVERAIGQAAATAAQGPTPGVSAALGNLGGAAARDAEGVKRRLAETLAMTTAEFAQRGVDAQAGKVSSIRNAQAVRDDEAGKIRRAYRGILSDRGTFAQQRAGELQESARERAAANRRNRADNRTSRRNNREDLSQSERNSMRSAGIDPDTGKPIPGGKADPKANKKKNAATNAQRADAQSAISLARTQAQRLKGTEGRARGEAAKALVEGRDDMTIKVDKDGRPLAQPVKVPGVAKVDQLWASVALDIEYDGVISRKNLRRLRSLGYTTRGLGVRKFKPKPPPKPDRNNRGADDYSKGAGRPD